MAWTNADITPEARRRRLGITGPAVRETLRDEPERDEPSADELLADAKSALGRADALSESTNRDARNMAYERYGHDAPAVVDKINQRSQDASAAYPTWKASPLADQARAEFPGQFEDVSDEELERKIVAQYPEFGEHAVYDHVATPTTAVSANEPDTYAGGFFKELAKSAPALGTALGGAAAIGTGGIAVPALLMGSGTMLGHSLNAAAGNENDPWGTAFDVAGSAALGAAPGVIKGVGGRVLDAVSHAPKKLTGGVGAALGGYEGYRRGGVTGGLEGAAIGATAGASLPALSKWNLVRRVLGLGAEAAPAEETALGGFAQQPRFPQQARTVDQMVEDFAATKNNKPSWPARETEWAETPEVQAKAAPRTPTPKPSGIGVGGRAVGGKADVDRAIAQGPGFMQKLTDAIERERTPSLPETGVLSEVGNKVRTEPAEGLWSAAVERPERMLPGFGETSETSHSYRSLDALQPSNLQRPDTTTLQLANELANERLPGARVKNLKKYPMPSGEGTTEKALRQRGHIAERTAKKLGYTLPAFLAALLGLDRETR